MDELLPKSERTKQLIVEKTAPLFNMKGYVGTSMSDITTVTKLTKGSIYGNFADKEAVALAAFSYNTRMRANAIGAHINKAKTYKDKLLVFSTVFNSKHNHVFPKGGCPLLNTGIEADDTHEDFRKAVSDELKQWEMDIVTIIKKGIEAGEFRRNVQAEQTAWSIIALIEGGIFVSQCTKNPAYLDTVLETVKDIVNSIVIGRKKQ
jgi:TetR/AcrR family transcriptional repressor of nem operon